MPTLLERYDTGDRRAVWDELHASRALVVGSIASRSDAAAVVRRTMVRSAHNLRTLHQRLVSIGYSFDFPEDAFTFPGDRHAAALKYLENDVGAVPATLKAFWSLVGGVNFCGWLPTLGSAATWRAQLIDPFEFFPDIENEADRIKNIPSEGARGFRLPIAADYLHKNDVSGGAPTVMLLPSDDVDACIVEDDGVWFRTAAANIAKPGDLVHALDAERPPRETKIWFVDYLRMYFEGGGFRRVAGTVSYPVDLLRGLSQGLLDI